MLYMQNFMTRLAKSRKTPAIFLVALSRSKYDDVRKWVADNDNTPTNTLDKLTKDENSTVKNHAMSAIFRREE